MKSKYPYHKKYRGGTVRLYGYDYAHEGYYFITICTKDRISYLGKIDHGKMQLSESGKIVADEWHKTGIIRKEQIALDEFCIMPNHVHGIIKIGNPILPSNDNRIPKSNFKVNQFGPQVKNLSSIVRGFKGSCTRRIRESHCPEFSWQRKFYEHIIRDLASLDKIRNYIKVNPKNWREDELLR